MIEVGHLDRWVADRPAGPYPPAVLLTAQRRGVSSFDRQYFVGRHWMYTARSSIFFDVGDDAAYLADHIAL